MEEYNEQEKPKLNKKDYMKKYRSNPFGNTGRKRKSNSGKQNYLKRKQVKESQEEAESSGKSSNSESTLVQNVLIPETPGHSAPDPPQATPGQFKVPDMNQTSTKVKKRVRFNIPESIPTPSTINSKKKTPIIRLKLGNSKVQKKIYHHTIYLFIIFCFHINLN